MEVFRIDANHFRMAQLPRLNESKHGVCRGKDYLGLRLKRLGLKTMLQSGLAPFLRHADVLVTGSIKGLGTPLEGLRLIHHTLHYVTQSPRPIDSELGAKFVPHA